MGLDDGFTASECHEPQAERDVRRVSRASGAPDKSEMLAHIIEAEIIPRLLLANGESARNGSRDAVTLDVDSQDIDDFADMMIGLELTRAQSVIASALTRGVALDTVMLEILAPTAQRLGERWTDDNCTFTDVTVGLCGLQSLLRSYEAGPPTDVQHPTGSGGALFSALPGEQHTFGVLMLETFFRRAGWDVVGMPLATGDEICAAVARRPFEIVGLSLSRESELPALRSLISSVRRSSRNPSIVVMVGGRVFVDGPEHVRGVGADMTAANGRDAVIASQHVLWSTSRTH